MEPRRFLRLEGVTVFVSVSAWTATSQSTDRSGPGRPGVGAGPLDAGVSRRPPRREPDVQRRPHLRSRSPSVPRASGPAAGSRRSSPSSGSAISRPTGRSATGSSSSRSSRTPICRPSPRRTRCSASPSDVRQLAGLGKRWPTRAEPSRPMAPRVGRGKAGPGSSRPVGRLRCGPGGNAKGEQREVASRPRWRTGRYASRERRPPGRSEGFR